MKHFYTKILFILISISSLISAQVVYTINSLADDEYSYAWDDPNTPDDESRDGICNDELGRCTLMAAISEASNMGLPVNINFSVEGTINLLNTVYLEDGSSINGGGKIVLKNEYACMQINNATTVYGLTFKDSFLGLSVDGDSNVIGNKNQGNTFINCYTGVIINGNDNAFYSNYVGLDSMDAIQPNEFGIMIYGEYNSIGSYADVLYGNTICASSYAGIYLAFGGSNVVSGNNIGVNIWGDNGYGNQQGILIEGSSMNDISWNIIGGNQEFGIFVGAAPPDAYSTLNIISNNFIGVDPLGEVIPNGNGIVITNGANYTEIDSNYIAGNIQNGISIFAYDDISKTIKTAITGNHIGLNSYNEVIPNNIGISIFGNVHSVVVGSDEDGIYNNPNIIVGNTNLGIAVTSEFGFSPDSIVFRKNIVNKNGTANIVLGTSCNLGIQPPYGLSFHNNTIGGIHDIPGALIDIYKANINDLSPSAYEWLGSTMVGSNGVFDYEITDPSIEAVSMTATISTSNTSGFGFIELITDVEKENENIPKEFSLAQNYPNPFNPTTTISFSIPKEEYVSLKVFNSLGEEVDELVNEIKPAGNYTVSFDARELTSGVYFYKMIAGNYVGTKKMLLLK